MTLLVFPLFVTEETFLFFVSISRELSNWESDFHLHEIFDTNPTVSQFCQEFRDFELTEPFSDRAIEFLSSHFYEIHGVNIFEQDSERGWTFTSPETGSAKSAN
jgi:hypothetical protein